VWVPTIMIVNMSDDEGGGSRGGSRGGRSEGEREQQLALAGGTQQTVDCRAR
jgi:hypothetical protein